MLHNSGPYGPPDTPVNMGAPLNMSQLNGLNLVNNLGKISQDAPHTAPDHYSHPNYPHYGSSTLNMTTQMNQFANFHNSGVHSNFGLQNSHLMENSPWHSGMLSMNLNLQHEHNANMLNFHQNYDKKPHGINHDSCHNNLPLNVPQLHSKEYFRHMNYDNSHFSVNSKGIEHNLSVKSNEKSQLDNTRRRSLENTVKLIENILLNSTNKAREHQSEATLTDYSKPDKTDRAPSPKPQMDPKQDDENEIVDMSERTLKSFYDKESRDSSQESFQSEREFKTEYTQESTSNMSKETEAKESVSEEITTEDEEIEAHVEVKLEPLTWTITDYTNPFLKDENAVTRDDAGGESIAEAETSVMEATEALKNGTKYRYYECPHCNLLISHPKRFLIHAKWHSFGFNKKAEIARQRELRRLEKKEQKAEKNMPEEFPCKDCDKMFATKTSLKNHRHRTHSSRAIEHRPRPRPAPAANHQCTQCPKRFKYKHSLDKHRDTHLEKTHGCSECPKKFGSQTLLKMHMKSHERASRGPTLSCSYCGKGYYEAYTLQVHERTHRNERPYICDICNSNFGCNSSLRRHMRVSHSTSKPHECTVCHRNFATESIRDRHQLRAHSDPEDFKFTCKQCPSRYFKLKDLQRHICKVHPKGKSRTRTKVEED